MAQWSLRTACCLAGDLLQLVSSGWRSHVQLVAENLFLRKQLALYMERQVKPRRPDPATRMTLVVLSQVIDWRTLLTVVKPDTLVRWHRQGFRLFWRWKSQPRGRPHLPSDLQRLIAEMARANRTWGEGVAPLAPAQLGITCPNGLAAAHQCSAGRRVFADWHFVRAPASHRPVIS